jgi:hypothetical protein
MPSRGKHGALSLMILAAMSLFVAGEGAAQDVLDTLGLPGRIILHSRIPVETQPGPIAEDRRSLSEPIVNRNSVGLQNIAGRPLTFRVEIAGRARDLTLAPQEIMTLDVGDDSGAKVTIGSGDTFTTTLLAKGQIYLLRAEGDAWVFSAL